MERSKKVILSAHCVLNQNTVVEPLARSKGAHKDIVQLIMAKAIGIHQLPCPEFRYLGLGRPPMTKEEYDTPEFRKLCKELASDSIRIVLEYEKSGYDIVGLLGINQSPTCSITGLRGIFMEELLSLLEGEGIILKTFEVPEDYYDGDRGSDFIDHIAGQIE
ncbi:CD3072 family TudS-related putative desulfidase [Gudongella oleilytica]|uniref:CD3072 family TudS-related putative desulfidase n=1 Tax=Gudongella oleilytica TaxID=1582259 RepID=UPI000FF87D57|nr:CD3072 family TudS-related putative desulfidase [Gudongella oleilytica]